MGREKFHEIWTEWDKIKDELCRTRAIYVYGTMGYGKSHILAALACLLIRNGERVIYLPDCGKMLSAPLHYFKLAFRLAFRAPKYASDLKKILECNSIEDLIEICQWWIDLTFIIDQKSALDAHPDATDNVSAAKWGLRQQLAQLGYSHITITSVSANQPSAAHMRRQQTNDKKIALLGGMSNVWSLVLNYA